jgi:hypothetical protein
MKNYLFIYFAFLFSTTHGQDLIEKRHKETILEVLNCIKRLDKPKLYLLIDTTSNKAQLDFDIRYLNKKFQNVDFGNLGGLVIKADFNPGNNLVNYKIRIPFDLPNIDYIDLDFYVVKNDMNGFIRIFGKTIHHKKEEPLIQAPKSSNLL